MNAFVQDGADIEPDGDVSDVFPTQHLQRRRVDLLAKAYANHLIVRAVLRNPLVRVTAMIRTVLCHCGPSLPAFCQPPCAQVPLSIVCFSLPLSLTSSPELARFRWCFLSEKLAITHAPTEYLTLDLEYRPCCSHAPQLRSSCTCRGGFAGYSVEGGTNTVGRLGTRTVVVCRSHSGCSHGHRPC